MVTDVLRGSKNQNIVSRGYDQLSTYGLLHELPEQEVRYYIESLLHLGLLKLTEGEYPVLKWTELSPAVVNAQQTLFFKKRNFKPKKEERERVKSKEMGKETVTLHYNTSLFEALRQLRLQIAREEEVPPYVVFNDRALQEMAVYFPQTEQEFAKINGVGPIKWIKYGEKFLEAIRAHGGLRIASEREQVVPPLERRSSIEETAVLYQQGNNIEQIMQIRQLAKSTILTHLTEAVQEGMDLDFTPLISAERQAVIKSIIAEVGAERLNPIKEKLPADFTYDEIRLVASFFRRRE